MNLDNFSTWEHNIWKPKVVVHFDYDGTLAEWKDLIPEIKRRFIAAGNSMESIEDVITDTQKIKEEVYKIINEPGYYYDLMPYENVVGFARELSDTGYDTRLLSCIVSEEAKEDKEFWINDFCAGIFGGTKENPELYRPYKRIYVPDELRAEKFAHIPDISDKNKIHILIDDHTPNCIAFESACKGCDVNGFAIKMFNDINGTHGRWQGFSLSNDMSPKEIMEEFKTIETYVRLKASIKSYPGNKDALKEFIDAHIILGESISRDDIKEFYRNDRDTAKEVEEPDTEKETEDIELD